MAHHNDIILDNRVRFGSSVRPLLRVDQMFAASGYRKTNRIHAEPLRTFQNLYKLQLVDIYALLNCWHAMGGPEDTALLRDWTDWHSGTQMAAERAGSMLADRITGIDQPLMNPNLSPITNTGDGVTTVFHTYKTYAQGASATNTYRIRHPVSAGFIAAVGGVDLGGGVSVNEANGEVTITPAPGDSPGDIITWGAQFYRPFHFLDEDIEERLMNRLVDSMRFTLMEAKGL